MKEMIRYEIYKLLHKPLAWAGLASILLFVGVMEWRWVAPGYAAIQADVNGRRKYPGLCRHKEEPGNRRPLRRAPDHGNSKGNSEYLSLFGGDAGGERIGSGAPGTLYP